VLKGHKVLWEVKVVKVRQELKVLKELKVG
jgi:hypothetical protein